MKSDAEITTITESTLVEIPKEDVQIGMVIHLDLPWLLHPFGKNNFRITTQNQLEKLRQLKIDKVKVDFKASEEQTLQPMPSLTESTPPPKEAKQENKTTSIPAATSLKKENRNAEKHIVLQRSGETYNKAITIVDDIFDNVSSNDLQWIKKSTNFISTISNSIYQDSESLVNFVNLEENKEMLHFHALNVSIIAMLMGKVANLSPEDMKILGMGALFHDIGYRNIPIRLLFKKESLTRAETQIIESHCEIGSEIAHHIPDFPKKAIDIIKYHHERINGSGYPSRLTGENIHFFAKIVAIADCYDNLAHPKNTRSTLLPHATLSNMYKNMKNVLPVNLIEVLIKSIGVYPPGSLVELNDGRIALVISVNHNSTIKPTVMVFNPEKSKQEPELIDLYEQKNVSITKALGISDVSQEVRDYLTPGRLAGYSFQASSFNDNEKKV